MTDKPKKTCANCQWLQKDYWCAEPRNLYVRTTMDAGGNYEQQMAPVPARDLDSNVEPHTTVCDFHAPVKPSNFRSVE